MSTHEALLSDVISEIVGACLDYAGDAVTDVFVYASLEAGYSVDVFFAQGPNIVRKHKLAGVDTSTQRQDALLKFGISQLEKLASESAKLGVATPTNIQIHYVLQSGAVEANFASTPQWTNHPDMYVTDLVDSWIARVQAARDRGEPAPM